MKFSKISIIFLFILLTANCFAADEYTASGTLSLRGGSKIVATSIKYEGWNHDGKLSCTTIDGVKINVNISDINRIYIDYLEKSYRAGISNSSKNIIVVALKNGNEKTMRYIEGSGDLLVTFQDPFTSKIVESKSYSMSGASQKVHGDSAVIQIDFTGAGNIKKNQKTDRFFPISYNYDPYTGEKLVLIKKK